MPTKTQEDLSNATTSQPAVGNVAAGGPVTPATYRQMLDVLENLLSHTHIFYDDYGTACNCNCQCNCTRGIL